MITAVDTNVLIDVIGADPMHGVESRNALDACVRAGRVVVCAEVVAELATGIGSLEVTIDVLRALKISYVAIEIEQAASAGVARSGSQEKSRITADYLVAAHAGANADQLLTRDAEMRSLTVPNLRVVSPRDVI